MSVSLGRGGFGVLLACVVVGLVVVVVVLSGSFGLVSGAWAAAGCANEVFRTGPSAGLPDCRAYEMVSPPNKNGGEVDGGVLSGELAAPEQAAVDGEAVTYGSTSAFLETGVQSAVVTSQYLSTRSAAGWRTSAVTPPQEIPGGSLKPSFGQPDFSLFQGFNEDLSESFLLAWNPQPVSSAPQGYFNPYLRDDENGKYQLLSSETPTMWPEGQVQLWVKGFGVVYAGMSSDGRHVIFEANEALVPGAVPGRVNLYEWSAGRPLELVSVLPDEGGAYTGGGEFTQEGGELKFGTAAITGIDSGPTSLSYNFSGALSRDGTRAFWTGGKKVYMHEIMGSGASRTVEVSASQKGAGGSGSGVYWTANSSGSLVYFTSAEQLTDDSTALPEIPHTTPLIPARPDLYQYDTETGVLSDLTVDRNAGETAEVQGVLGSGESEGVSSVYFVAHGVLAEGAHAGAENLYVSRGGASEPTFIATLGESGAVLGEGGAEKPDFAEAVMARTSRVSPDGRLLAFQSELPLTGYDNVPASGACPLPEYENDVLGGYFNAEGRCMEVYEYDESSGRLVCASCDPSGLPPTGQSIVPEVPHLFETVNGWESSTVQQRYLLDDGRLFFDSEDALLGQATDGKRNVYEYEPEGVGGCAASGAGSCLYLISTGASSQGSSFLDASADGRDVFFLTREQLVAQDGDEAIDVYDAREGGGFAEAQAPPCAGEACKPAIAPAPAIYGAPSSATFQGAGNLPALPEVKPVVKAKKKPKKRPARRKTRKRARRAARSRSGRSSGRFVGLGGRSERGGR
jgi:hypothetical protein